MNILILINAAPGHRPFFAKVGEVLTRAGHRVYFALDSHFSDFLYPEANLPEGRVTYFSDYFQANYESCSLSPEFARLNLWTAIFPDLDRAEYSFGRLRGREYYDKLLASMTAYFDDLLRRHGIDVVVYETVSNAFAYVAYLVAHERNVDYVGFAMSRLPCRIDVTDQSGFRHSRTERIYRGILSGTVKVPDEVREAAADYMQNIDRKRADYVTLNASLNRSPFLRYLRKEPFVKYLRACRFYLSNPERHYYAFQISNPIVDYVEHFGRETFRWAKGCVLKELVELPDLERPFFVYPLQYHPESSSSVDGPYFNDELVNVVNTAMNLPPHHLLYVKEHPCALGLGPVRLYRRILRIPNARLVDAAVDGRTLIRHARAVVTNTSSFGFEAVVLGKPVFVLGHPFYEFHPLVRRVRSWDESFRQFQNYASVHARPEEIVAFVQAYFMCSRAGSFDLKSNLDNPQAIELIARLVVEEYETRREHRSSAGEVAQAVE